MTTLSHDQLVQIVEMYYESTSSSNRQAILDTLSIIGVLDEVLSEIDDEYIKLY